MFEKSLFVNKNFQSTRPIDKTIITTSPTLQATTYRGLMSNRKDKQRIS